MVWSFLAFAAPVVEAPSVRRAWGVKPVLGVTLLHRWDALADCGFSATERDDLRALGEDVAARADAWRREGDAAIRAGRSQVPAVLDQPGAVAALAAEEAAAAEVLTGARLGCLLDQLDGWWAEDRARSTARVATSQGPSSLTVTLTYNVFATQFAANTDDEVAIPDYCIKFANLGWETCSAGYADDPYYVELARDGYRDTVWVGDVGPWNIDDNYWNAAGDAVRPRRLYADLAQGYNEARAAYYDDYNGGRDQYGRTVSNPAGVDLAVEEAYDMGLAYLQNDWMDVTFTWETVTVYPWMWLGLAFEPRDDQPADAVPEGASAGVYDAWDGQTWTAEVRLGNTGTARGEGVVLGLEAGPGVRVRHWAVDSDHPYQDQSTWTSNSANDNAENPSHDDPGEALLLHLDGFAPYETKRVVLTLEGAGGPATAAVRTWLAHVDDYWEQPAYDAAPTNVGGHQTWNGGVLALAAGVDVWPRETAWTFDGSTEGWFVGNAGTVAASAAALTFVYGGEDPTLVGPPVAVAASPSDLLTLASTASAGGEARLYWSTVEAPGFAEERSLAFPLPAGRETVVLEVGAAAGWTGTVDRLRLDPTPAGEGSWALDEIVLDAASAEETGVLGQARVERGEAAGCACGRQARPELLGLVGILALRRRRRGGAASPPTLSAGVRPGCAWVAEGRSGGAPGSAGRGRSWRPGRS